MLNRIPAEYGAETVDLDLTFYTAEGDPMITWQLKEVPCTNPFVLDSKKLPKEFQIQKPFNGTLLMKIWINLPDKEVIKKQRGLFSSTRTFIDFYREGDFVTSTHDYCQYLPDQGINPSTSGMIPAYCNGTSETFIVIHATKPGIGPRDLQVTLYNEQGNEKRVPLPPFKPFSMRRIMISELFPDAEIFLGGRLGQVEIEGNFPQIMKRIAYGIQNKQTGTFSFDHAFHVVDSQMTVEGSIRVPMTAEQRERWPKGWFTPFFVIETEQVSSSAILFHSVRDILPKHIDLLLYDMEGKRLKEIPSYAYLSKNEVKRVDVRELLLQHGIPLPFIGMVELIYHKDPSYKYYSRVLDVCVEYNTKGRFGSVIYGSELWNGPKAIQNNKYHSCSRIVCNEAQTTYLAISNCGYTYDYSLSTRFTLNLCSKGGIKRKATGILGPNATIFKAIDEFFPDAQELLAGTQGVGYSLTTDIDCSYLVHQFMTQDRKSGVFAVEHNINVPVPNTSISAELVSITT